MAAASQSDLSLEDINEIRGRLADLAEELIFMDPSVRPLWMITLTEELVDVRKRIRLLPNPKDEAGHSNFQFMSSQGRFCKKLLQIISQFQSLKNSFEARNRLIIELERIDSWWPEDLVAKLILDSNP